MIIKFIDKEGSLRVVTVQDDADFKVRSNEAGMHDIYAKLPRQLRRTPEIKLAELLDKETADKCIERICDQLIAKKDFCDLAEIQSDKSVDTSELGENNNE